jgi:hypothetical protein
MWLSRRSQRGSTLLLSVILLAVLTALGLAAVSLSARERQNASSQAKYQRLIECASAAQSMIWAQLARHGANYLGSSLPVGQITLPDGTQFAAPIHYDQPVGTGTASVAYTIQNGGGGQGQMDVDCTNKLCGQANSGNPVLIVARCTDPSGRQYEVEMSFAFAL